MKKIKMEVELTFDDDLMYGDDKNGEDWFWNVIMKDEQLLLHSNEIGDTIGEIKITKIKDVK